MFFKKKEKENLNEDLKKLQELTAKLEELYEQKDNIVAPPAYEDYDGTPYARRSWDGTSISIANCDDLGWYISQAAKRRIEPFEFIHFIRNYLPTRRVDYLKDLGEYLVMISDLMDIQGKLSTEISKTEVEIKEIKEKLHVI